MLTIDRKIFHLLRIKDTEWTGCCTSFTSHKATFDPKSHCWQRLNERYPLHGRPKELAALLSGGLRVLRTTRRPLDPRPVYSEEEIEAAREREKLGGCGCSPPSVE
jgi:hypothetical protein